MEVVFAHSWELLTEEEQTVFKSLSVFRGDFDFVAAEQVAGASLSTLKSLVNKSHVYPQGQGRYHLHALLRQFGHAIRIHETHPTAKSVYDPFAVADDRFFVHRFHFEELRGLSALERVGVAVEDARVLGQNSMFAAGFHSQ